MKKTLPGFPFQPPTLRREAPTPVGHVCVAVPSNRDAPESGLALVRGARGVDKLANILLMPLVPTNLRPHLSRERLQQRVPLRERLLQQRPHKVLRSMVTR
mmetsp:Transcript_15815/g.20271  ORF Transcript_15815/g.20271 Transcript_15815/m.20271 type:complete len:101 (-) Transcript_15815:181-483(-)